MTFLEKLKADNPKFEESDINAVIENDCPDDYGYENNSDCDCISSDEDGKKCRKCWNREMPNTETKEDISFVDQVFNAYNDGLNDAWELVNKLLDIPSDSIKKELFGTVFVTDIMKDYTPQEALAKLKAYEEAQIEVGDVVEYGKELGVVIFLNEKNCNLLFRDGAVSFLVKIVSIKKTGKHLDISSILEQIGE